LGHFLISEYLLNAYQGFDFGEIKQAVGKLDFGNLFKKLDSEQNKAWQNPQVGIPLTYILYNKNKTLLQGEHLPCRIKRCQKMQS